MRTSSTGRRLIVIGENLHATRVVKRDGLVVIVDSIQRGDRPSWDGLLDLFPHYFHEPFYAEYANGSIESWFLAQGFAPFSSERAFLSKVAAFRPV